MICWHPNRLASAHKAEQLCIHSGEQSIANFVHQHVAMRNLTSGNHCSVMCSCCVNWNGSSHAVNHPTLVLSCWLLNFKLGSSQLLSYYHCCSGMQCWLCAKHFGLSLGQGHENDKLVLQPANAQTVAPFAKTAQSTPIQAQTLHGMSYSLQQCPHILKADVTTTMRMQSRMLNRCWPSY